MTDAMSKLLAGLHIEQTETQQCNNEASLYNERGQWIAEVAYADAAEAMVAAVNEYDEMRVVIAKLLTALFLVTADEFSMAEFRTQPGVKEAEKYARDWAEEETK